MKYSPLALILLLSCGTPAVKTEKKLEAVVYYQADLTTAGALSGHVRFAGKAPSAKKISMAAEEDCEKLHAKPVLEQPVALGPKGQLKDALVYVKTGLEGKVFGPSGDAVIMDQKGCQFIPRVVAVRAGQMFQVKNSDPVTHSIHPMGKNNRDWNQSQAPGAENLARKFARAEVAIPVKCNVHGWMHSHIAVFEHPYYALTKEDGSYELPNLPPGDYTIGVWHETLGEQTHTIHIANREKVALEIEFRP